MTAGMHATTRPSALITGASRGIGNGIARHLAAQGWALTINARDAQRLEQSGLELKSLGAAVQVVAGDLADETVADALIERHMSEYETLNALILSAGVGTFAPIDGYAMRRFDKQFGINVRTPFQLVSRALPMLRAGAQADPQRGGRIVALTSIEGVYPEGGLSVYSATKAALISLVRSINLEEAANGITASAISPGYVDTDMTAWTTDTIPADTMITVDDIVKAVHLVLTLSPTATIPHLVIHRTSAGPHSA